MDSASKKWPVTHENFKVSQSFHPEYIIGKKTVHKRHKASTLLSILRQKSKHLRG
jgi:hypothetical protein